MKRQKVRSDDYVYRRLPGKDSDEDGEETELFSIKKNSRPYKEIPTVEKIVQEGDTLQSLSIRYHCPIAELKRLNNIHKENEIYARNTIKVPARPFTSALAGVHDSGNTSPNGGLSLAKVDTDLLEHKLTTCNQTPDTSTDLNSVIFNSNIISKPAPYTDELPDVKNVEEEEICLIPNEPVPVDAPVPNNFFTCNDADISWIALIVCIMVVIFAVPVLYVVYIYEHPKEFQHKHEHS